MKFALNVQACVPVYPINSIFSDIVDGQILNQRAEFKYGSGVSSRVPQISKIPVAETFLTGT